MVSNVCTIVAFSVLCVSSVLNIFITPRLFEVLAITLLKYCNSKYIW